jgi:hypothetical protein
MMVRDWNIDTLREEWNKVDDQRLEAIRDENLEMEIIAMAQLDVLEDQIERRMAKMEQQDRSRGFITFDGRYQWNYRNADGPITKGASEGYESHAEAAIGLVAFIESLDD